MFSLEEGRVIIEDNMKIEQLLSYENYEKNYEFIARDSNIIMKQ